MTPGEETCGGRGSEWLTPRRRGINSSLKEKKKKRKKEMTSRDWQPSYQRLPCRAGIAAAPTPNLVGPRRRDDEPMMKPRRRTRTGIDCNRVSRNGASQAQSNEDHKSSLSIRPTRRGRRYQTLPKDQAGRATHDLQHQSPQ